MTAHDVARLLPDVPVLRDLCRSMAVLEAILSPDWEGRYHCFDAAWGPLEEIASIRNGSGDEYSIIFSAEGAYIRGFDHEAAIGPYGNDGPWPGDGWSVTTWSPTSAGDGPPAPYGLDRSRDLAGRGVPGRPRRHGRAPGDEYLAWRALTGGRAVARRQVLYSSALQQHCLTRSHGTDPYIPPCQGMRSLTRCLHFTRNDGF